MLLVAKKDWSRNAPRSLRYYRRGRKVSLGMASSLEKSWPDRGFCNNLCNCA